MESETQALSNFTTPMWHGKPDPTQPPGDIDPQLAILIADLGLGYDQPVALDYRLSREEPRVLTLRWEKPAPPVPWEEIEPWREGKRHYDKAATDTLKWWCATNEEGGWNRWVTVAPDFATFAAMLGL